MNPNAVNQFLKDTVIYAEGEPVFSIAMIVKGRVLIHNDGAKIIMGSGAFLGINDLYSGRYQSTYTAYDEALIYVFPISRIEEMENILSVKKDYHGFMVASYYKIINDLHLIYQGLLKHGSEIYQFLTETYHNYVESGVQRGLKIIKSDRIETLEPLDYDIEMISDRIRYYSECRSLPVEVIKSFYSHGNLVTLYQLEDQISVVNQLITVLKEMSESYVTMVECLVDDSDLSLFNLITSISGQTDNISGMELLDILDNIVEKVNKAELFAEKMIGRKLKMERKRMEEGYHRLLSGAANREKTSETDLKYSKEAAQEALLEMKDSFDKIIEYAAIDVKNAAEMKAALTEFLQMKDKFSSEDTARKLRRKLADYHYDIYTKVFKKAYIEKNVPRIIDLFLKYGFVDDRLLTNEQMLSLYFLEEEHEEDHACNVFDIKTWLTMIYEGKREPSKNEFDMEYPEMLADLKRQGRIKEKEVSIWMADSEKKLEYEIQNMFRYNNRTTSGQIASFVPFLHKDQWSNNIERMFVTSAKVNETIAKIMKVDFSVFDREVLYVNKEKNIVKEYIIKRVYPDIVLMPNIGTNGVMWQEISGKRRDSAGRIFLPIFTDVELKALLVRQFGRFRWELCRTIEGTAWNDIKQKSLTSEYSDYLQFYRKNKELSEERRERIKQQIQKGRNNTREVFVLDYEQWINYEAIGAIKLNKPVREIMATYCPFARELREQLKLQPLFEEAMAKYNRDKLKKVRELEGRQRFLLRDKIELTPELIDTLNYFRDL